MCVFSIVFTSHLVTIKNRYYLPLIILLFTSIVFSFLTVSRSAYICTFFSAILFMKISLFQKYNPYSGVKKQQFVLKVLKMFFVVVTLFSIVFIVLDNSRIYKILERFDRSTQVSAARSLRIMEGSLKLHLRYIHSTLILVGIFGGWVEYFRKKTLNILR